MLILSNTRAIKQSEISMTQPKIFLDQNELASRWLISPRTLERWRWVGGGPKVTKIGGRCLYRLSDVEAFEEKGRDRAV